MLPRGLLYFWVVLGFITLVCLAFVDQPVALAVAPLAPYRLIFQACAAPSLLPLPVSLLYLAYAVLQRTSQAPKAQPLFMAMSLATLAATAAKDELKWMFGRSWPEFWLHDGIYGFRPFTDSYYYGSFPSGHLSYIAAPLGVLWALKPGLRLACAGVISLVMFGLVAADYHYVADVTSGLLTGTICAWGTCVLLRLA